MSVWMKVRQKACVHVSYAGWWYFADALDQESGNISGPDDKGPIRRFLDEAVFNIDGHTAFITSISFLLKQKAIVDARLLSVLDGLYSLSWSSPKILEGLSSDVYDELRNSCAVACQRQLCLGAWEVGELAYDMLGMFFHYIT